MASYDSDSSVGEDEEYTETDVLLGYPSKDPNGETISRLGGRPEWIDPTQQPPSAALAKCQSCKGLMVLLLQLNAELSDRFPGHDRRLYVFSCPRKACRRKEGSVRALRGVRVTESAPAVAKASEPQESEPQDGATAGAASPRAPATAGLGETLFGIKAPTAGGSRQANPFSSSSVNPFSKPSASPSANPFAKAPAPSQPAKAAEIKPASKPEEQMDALPKTFAETLSIGNPQQQPRDPPPAPEPWPPESDQPSPYPISWLAEAEYETLDPSPPPRALPSASASDLDSGSGGGKEDKEVFESSMDSTFQKFADRIGQNPEQCIRYEFGGQPLLYSKTDGPGALLAAAASASETGVSVGVRTSRGIPRCPNCGAGRVFEVQLAPPAIEQLEAEEDGLDGMDWGTILVGVCERDCTERGRGVGEAGYLEEWAGVQWEELAVRR